MKRHRTEQHRTGPRRTWVPQVSLPRPGWKRTLGTSIAVFFLCWALLPGGVGIAFAQNATPQNPSQQKQPVATSGYGQTIFSRSAPLPPNSAQKPAPQPTVAQSQAKPATHALASNTERTALTFTSYDFEVHLEPSRHSLAVHARLVAENGSDKPLARIALQLSSSLHWYSIRVNGAAAKFQTETVESDIDHTGKLTEAVAALASPLAPGAAVHLDVLYSGTVEASAERLLRLGAPAKVAASSEWDRIGTGFTALRGFGNVIWFPVSTAPVLLGQGARMFDSIGKWKLRESDATVKMHVLVEYLDTEPNVAFLNGNLVLPDGASNGAQASSDAATHAAQSNGTAFSSSTTASSAPESGNTVLQVVSFTLPSARLGFSPLSFFVMDAADRKFPGLDIYTRRGNEAAAPAYAKIAENDRPPIEQWLGPHPKRPVVLVDLPDRGDLPFEERNILFLPLMANVSSDSAGPVMAHMLSHSYFVSPRPWLNEGVAQFMTLLWIEQRAGRATAIGQMDSRRAALALAETGDPGVNPGQSLIEAWSDIYYRDKAADVLWMLRDMVGDAPLARALQAYDPAKDREASTLQTLLQKTSGKDLEWFFDDWVYRDRGLPDLHIVSAYRRPILTKNSAARNYLVSIEVRNDSFCSAEVPVAVQSALTTESKRLLVPAHQSATVRMLVASLPTKATVNDGSVPEVRTSHHEKTIVPAQ